MAPEEGFQGSRASCPETEWEFRSFVISLQTTDVPSQSSTTHHASNSTPCNEDYSVSRYEADSVPRYEVYCGSQAPGAGMSDV